MTRSTRWPWARSFAIAHAIALEGRSGRMEGEAVDLDDEVRSRPEEVHLVAGHADVGLRDGEARRADEVQQAALGLGAGEGGIGGGGVSKGPRCAVPWVALELRIEGLLGHEVEDLSLLDGPGEFPGAGVGCQVEQGAGRSVPSP